MSADTQEVTPEELTESETANRSAVSAGETPEADQSGPQAPAREDTQSNHETAITWRSPLRVAWRGIRWLGGEFRPPETWDEPQPSIEEMWRYTRRGEWTDESGPLRWFAAAYTALVVIPTALVFYGLVWLIRSPARVLALFVGAAIVLAAAYLAGHQPIQSAARGAIWFLELLEGGK